MPLLPMCVPPPSSGQPKGILGEQFDTKNKLTCSICLKEFKSLPALNGHMRSHGGMRASPSLKQVSRSRHPALLRPCATCFALPLSCSDCQPLGEFRKSALFRNPGANKFTLSVPSNLQLYQPEKLDIPLGEPSFLPCSLENTARRHL